METPTLPAKVIFPYFEKGMPLRSRDLNAVFRRSEEEVRHTRTYLQGMGIFYGLQVAQTASGKPSDPTVLTVQSGAGVTSEGYLYYTPANVSLSQLKEKSKILLSQFTTEPFSDFLDAPVLSDKEENEQVRLEVIELTNGGDNTADLRVGDLQDKRLVVFFEIIKTPLKGCASCEKGTRADLAVKYLLIDKNNWDQLEPALECGAITPGDQENSFAPLLLSLPRLGFQDACFGFSNPGDLKADYEAIITDEQVKSIVEALNKTLDKASAIFDIESKNADSLLVLPKIITGLNAQYVHDYLRLIIRAYNEFVATPFARSFASLPPETCFPKHLVLGKFDAEGTFTKAERTPLYRPPFDDATDADFGYAHNLYDRLIGLLRDTDWEGLEKSEGTKRKLKITPSRRATFPIGMQAVPFYMKAAVKENWRPNFQFPQLIPHYDDKDTDDEKNIKSLKSQPHFDEADFYRIEGHVGNPLRNPDDQQNSIEFQRNCLNLPFQIIAVSATSVQDDDPLSLAGFARQHPGLEHQGGVPAGGTFVVVVSGENDRITSDFCLPYWVQPPAPKPVVADFEIEKDSQKTTETGESFTFINTSENFDRVEWRVNGGDQLSSEDRFTHIFGPIGELPVSHHFVTLTAIKDTRKSVEKTTIVVVRIKDKRPQPKADFAVENLANVVTSDPGDEIRVTITNVLKPFEIELAFENLSENADTYQWFIDQKKQTTPVTKDKLIHKFRWTPNNIDTKVFEVMLVASQENQENDTATKKVVAVRPEDPAVPVVEPVAPPVQ